MGKKDRTTIVNNINELNLEIDYDKLAEAMVLAQQKANESTKRPKSIRTLIMSTANTVLPAVVALIALMAGIGMCMEIFTDPVHSVLFYFVFAVSFIIVISVSICCAIEAWNDREEAAIQHFNSNIALAALVVSLVALLQGVG